MRLGALLLNKVNHPMPLTISELEAFKNSVTFLTQLRAIPLPIIEFYLENECGYRIKEPDADEEKTVMIRPSGLSQE
ncbi:MAG TPA: hypothetical protein P5329_06180 [Candidatus Competibacteraceae bacterium]|nr:hypothetical protein [Candidatus Competibacteraceae bacterium]